MKKLYYALSCYFMMLVLSVPSDCQTLGAIKVFSEIDNYEVYLNEGYKGFNLTTIDSVPAGSHYLKVVAYGANVFSEIITVNSASVATILIKDSKETRDKILQAKYKEVEEYNAKKLDIMLSSKYVTQTTSSTKSMYFPDYYVATGFSQSSSYSTTTEVSDWFITQGGVHKLDEHTFAVWTNNQDALNSIANEKDAFYKHQKTYGTTLGVLGAVFGLGGLTMGIYGVVVENWGLAAAGFLFELLGVKAVKMMAEGDSDFDWKTHHMSMKTAIEDANKYNQELKIKLGLPMDYEPQK